MTDWYKSESDCAPVLLDLTSSATTVYERRNVRAVERKEQDGTKRMVFEYEERCATMQEYAAGVAAANTADIAQNQADIEYIAMETGVEL